LFGNYKSLTFVSQKYIIMKIINAKYVSIWDGGVEIKSTCTFDVVNNVVSQIESVEVDGLEILEDEYVLLSDGTEIRDFINEDDLDNDIDPAGGYGLYSHI